MNVLMLNGSPHSKGNTATALNEMAAIFEAECIRTEIITVGNKAIRSCIACNKCSELGRCVFDDLVNEISPKSEAAVVATRRAGTTATFDELNKFFYISGMPVASGQYWNVVHGTAPGEAAQDIEGLQQMRTLARNMTFLMKSIALGKQEFGIPEREPFAQFNFIR